METMEKAIELITDFLWRNDPEYGFYKHAREDAKKLVAHLYGNGFRIIARDANGND